jgi:hypothetical protein
MRYCLHLAGRNPWCKEMHFASHHVRQDQGSSECIHCSGGVRQETERLDPKMVADGQDIIRPVQWATSVVRWVAIATADAWSLDGNKPKPQCSRQLVVERRHKPRESHTDADKHRRSFRIPDLRKADRPATNNVTDLLVEALCTQKPKDCIFHAIPSLGLRSLVSPSVTCVADRLASRISH